MKMQSLVWSLVGVVMMCSSAAWASGAGPGVTADQALDKLQQGNTRFVAGKQEHPQQDFARRELTTTKGQHPFATILSCSDSRVPPEILFDQGIGDVFIIRVAGNVANVDEAASIEYAVDHLNTPLLVVLGHSHCGAVTAVVKGADTHGNIPALLRSIVPAVAGVRAQHPTATGEQLINDCIKANVWQAIEDLFRTSAVVAAKTKAGKLKVVGALYDISTGRVSWLGTHPQQDKLVAAFPWGSSAGH
jgi:carbonic anhydrase